MIIISFNLIIIFDTNIIRKGTILGLCKYLGCRMNILSLCTHHCYDYHSITIQRESTVMFTGNRLLTPDIVHLNWDFNPDICPWIKLPRNFLQGTLRCEFTLIRKAAQMSKVLLLSSRFVIKHAARGKAINYQFSRP